MGRKVEINGKSAKYEDTDRQMRIHDRYPATQDTTDINNLHIINPVYLRPSSQIALCHDCSTSWCGQDLQTLSMSVLIRSLHCVRRLTCHLTLGGIAPRCYSRVTLQAVPQGLLQLSRILAPGRCSTSRDGSTYRPSRGDEKLDEISARSRSRSAGRL